MRQALQSADAGVHLKTAGTTWLEELIGLAEAGGVEAATAGLAAVFGVADAPRETSVAAVDALRDMDVRVVMLTGDNRRTAEAIARQAPREGAEPAAKDGLHPANDAALQHYRAALAAQPDLEGNVDPARLQDSQDCRQQR